jgi:dCTP deaminase
LIASAQTLRLLKPVEPFVERSTVGGMSYGLSSAGYDVRIAEPISLNPGEFALASTMERFKMPNHLIGIVHDKSTWARRGLAVQNTVIEPGWEGYLTLELTNHNPYEVIGFDTGWPVAQIVFHLLDQPTDQPYTGKYQNQEAGPQEARYE